MKKKEIVTHNIDLNILLAYMEAKDYQLQYEI